MIEITWDALGNIRRHSRSVAPKEACGILSGPVDKNRVTEVFRCKNVDENPLTAYTIEPRELIDVINTIENSSRDLMHIGFYHSHPFSSPLPSVVDERKATWDKFIYAIYSAPQDKIGCWRWSDDKQRFIEEDVVLTA
jgi:proteasome lid subunit RPN8/RPN11